MAEPPSFIEMLHWLTQELVGTTIEIIRGDDLGKVTVTISGPGRGWQSQVRNAGLYEAVAALYTAFTTGSMDSLSFGARGTVRVDVDVPEGMP